MPTGTNGEFNKTGNGDWFEFSYNKNSNKNSSALVFDEVPSYGSKGNTPRTITTYNAVAYKLNRNRGRDIFENGGQDPKLLYFMYYDINGRDNYGYIYKRQENGNMIRAWNLIE